MCADWVIGSTGDRRGRKAEKIADAGSQEKRPDDAGESHDKSGDAGFTHAVNIGLYAGHEHQNHGADLSKEEQRARCLSAVKHVKVE